MEESLTEVMNDVAELKQSLTAVKDDIAEMKESLTEVKDDVATLKADVATVRTKLEKHCPIAVRRYVRVKVSTSYDAWLLLN